MKIWIVSSDPFLDDFTRIAFNWPGDDVYITRLSNYGLGLRGNLAFLNTFRKFKPDSILTDHGFPGFFWTQIYSIMLFKKSPLLSVLLRGNYWLESGQKSMAKRPKAKTQAVPIHSLKGLLKRILPISRRRSCDLRLNLPQDTRYSLVDSSTGIKLAPNSITLSNGDMCVFYSNLWLGDFSLEILDDKINFNTNHFGKEVINDGASLEVTPKRLPVIELSPSPLREIFRLANTSLAKFGWDYTLRNCQNLFVVCEYLQKAVTKNIHRHSMIIPIPISQDDVPKTLDEIKLNHPAALLVQNHQIRLKSEALISFREVIANLPGVTFYISEGLPENRGNVYHEAVIDTLSPLQNVEFLEINKTNKYDYLAAADFYILRSGLDCTPATILEAGLMKKPVLASAVGGVPEMIQEGRTGWAINNSNHEEWEAKIQQFANKPKLAEEMGENNYAFVLANYNIGLIAEKLHSLMINK